MLKYILLFVLFINLINCKAVDKPPQYYIIDIYFNGCNNIIRTTLDVNTFESKCYNVKDACNSTTTNLGLKVSYEYGNLYMYKRYTDSKCVISDPHYFIFNCSKSEISTQNSTSGYSVQCFENTAPVFPKVINGDEINGTHQDTKPTVVKPKYASDSSINLDEINTKKEKSKTKSPIPIINNQEPDYTANSIKLTINFLILIISISILIF